MKRLKYILILSVVIFPYTLISIDALAAPPEVTSQIYPIPTTGVIGTVNFDSAQSNNGIITLTYHAGNSTKGVTASRQLCSDVKYYYSSALINAPANFINTIPNNSQFTLVTKTADPSTSCIRGVYFEPNWNSGITGQTNYTIKPVNGKKIIVGFTNKLTFRAYKKNSPLKNSPMKVSVTYGVGGLEPSDKIIFQKTVNTDSNGIVSLNIGQSVPSNSTLSVAFQDELGGFSSYSDRISIAPNVFDQLLQGKISFELAIPALIIGGLISGIFFTLSYFNKKKANLQTVNNQSTADTTQQKISDIDQNNESHL
ncbi:MAG TPA: hypothetical protein VIH90_02585 [Candidatus Saccharimonadales bacterium]